MEFWQTNFKVKALNPPQRSSNSKVKTIGTMRSSQTPFWETSKLWRQFFPPRLKGVSRIWKNQSFGWRSLQKMNGKWFIIHPSGPMREKDNPFFFLSMWHLIEDSSWVEFPRRSVYRSFSCFQWVALAQLVASIENDFKLREKIHRYISRKCALA